MDTILAGCAMTSKTQLTVSGDLQENTPLGTRQSSQSESRVPVSTNEKRASMDLVNINAWPLLVASVRNQRPLDLGQKIWVTAVAPFSQRAFYCILLRHTMYLAAGNPGTVLTCTSLMFYCSTRQ